jgi:hypothetical protein
VEGQYIDSKSTALAPFGYGLSYTTFSYSDFILNIDKDGTAIAKVIVTNCGTKAGDEVVQLYGEDLAASMIRPRHELIGFKRVTIESAKSKEIIFYFNLDALAFTNRDKKWIVEKGEFRFVVGAHSNDVRGEFLYTLQETREIDRHKRCFFATVEVADCATPFKENSDTSPDNSPDKLATGKFNDKTTLKDVLNDPDMKRVLLKYTPDIENNTMLGMSKGLTLNKIKKLIISVEDKVNFEKAIEELRLL